MPSRIDGVILPRLSLRMRFHCGLRLVRLTWTCGRAFSTSAGLMLWRLPGIAG